MRKYWIGFLCAVIVIAVMACTPQPQTLPTLIPSPTTMITPSEAPAGVTATVTSRRVPPTFPPTWTPEGEATIETVVETPTTEPPTQVPASPPATALEACNTFVEDTARNTRNFPLGAAPQVFWTAVQGAATYHIALVAADPAATDSQPIEVFADFVSDTTYTFQADLFERGMLYGWEIYPLDGIGQQMCASIGAELNPQ
jgi:hypothetical protein